MLAGILNQRSPENLLLPNLTGISLRRINSSAQYAINLRKSTTGAIQAIGFDSNGDLDIAAINTFLGSATGFIKDWYVQPSTTNLFSQTTNTNQAQLSLNTYNNKPCAIFTGTQFYTSTLKTNGGDYSFNYVVRSDVGFNSIILSEMTFLGNTSPYFSGSGNLSVASNGTFKNQEFSQYTNSGNYQSVLQTGVSTYHFAGVRKNAQYLKLYSESSLKTQVSVTNFTGISTNPLKLGQGWGTSPFLNNLSGKIAEIIFDLDVAWTDSQAIAIQTNTDAYWGTT
jgi:hypothetical protein